VTIRLGLQIPNFSYGAPVAELFPAVTAQAQEAEAAGFDTILVMDHFYQLPTLGEPDEPMLEAYTALGALASATEKIQLPTHGYMPGVITKVGEALKPLVSA
jgi:alkanesulfonate monooxygenase SsuD/methylene tetrahydromethanopterin reductase-like flavin-dependent oxidoreductase (luciferase family)